MGQAEVIGLQASADEVKLLPANRLRHQTGGGIAVQPGERILLNVNGPVGALSQRLADDLLDAPRTDARDHDLAPVLFFQPQGLFQRVLVEVLVVNRSLLAPLLPAIAAMTLVSAGFAWFLLRGAGAAREAEEVRLQNPFSLTSAMKFAALFAVVLLVVKIVNRSKGWYESGLPARQV